ncbi:MAG: hypothetical protein AB2598_20700 [Candidatus Thiodiazotropha sp.]
MYGTDDLLEINDFFSNPVTGWEEVGVGVTGEEWNAWFLHQQEQRQGGGWMGSQGHRENILKFLFDDMGVGYVWDQDGGDGVLLDSGELTDFPLHTYWTQDFASGDSLAPVPLPGAFWLLGSGLLSLIVLGRGREGVKRSIRGRAAGPA